MAEPPKNGFSTHCDSFFVQNHFLGVLPSDKTQNVLELKNIL
jgi:hypothetical protein